MDIDGKKIADEILDEIKRETKNLGFVPGIAFVLVGNDPASQTYVRMKEKKCKEVGFHSEKFNLDERVSQIELLTLIDKLNIDDKIDGIIVQMPLPSHITVKEVLNRIKPEKDIDGFHPINIGRMFSGDRLGPLPCTPAGILTLLEKSNVKVESAHVVVVGRSNIVGRPIAHLLSQKELIGNATVTLAHSKTKNLGKICKQADILIAAIGKAKTITHDMVKPGCVVIDVGVNRTDSGKLVGDVDYDKVKPIASQITPVPGGVGPMTIAMLLKNTLECAKRRSGE